MRHLLATFVLFAAVSGGFSFAEDKITIRQSDLDRLECIPGWAMDIIESSKTTDRHDISFQLNPFYLRGDFDGDKIMDIAIMIKNKKSGEAGILIIHRKTKKVFIVGAGKNPDDEMKDYSWVNAWYVYEKGKVSMGADETPPPTLKGDGLYVINTECCSRIVYWDGKKYRWYQKGD